MSYREAPWSARFASLGDEAEGVFEAVLPLGKVQRFGWRRPDVPMTNMGARVRHMPDYYAASGYLVEVMGLGRDGILKLKLDKWDALKWWNQSGNKVALFVWNSSKKMYVIVAWDALRTLVGRARQAGIASFQVDGNEYYPIQWEWIAESSLPIPWEVG